MNFLTFSWPPSSWKTSVILKVIKALEKRKIKIAVVKMDCLNTDDDLLYQKAWVEVKKILSTSICPDHFFVTNVEEMFNWWKKVKADTLITESAWLCNRCSPYIEDIKSICVIDNLSWINTPKKIWPMLKMADIVVITKWDIVSQAEREIFASRVENVNPKAKVIHVNWLNGQWAYELSNMLEIDMTTETLEWKKMRFPLPNSVCSYCLGETRIGKKYQMWNVRKINLS